MKKIAIFASGTGSNALKIIEYLAGHKDMCVQLIVSNKKEAGVLTKAKTHNIDTLVINRDAFYKTDKVVKDLKERGIDFIVLAGFLWLIPSNLVSAYTDRIVNIHPALLPKYGGKGMYGHHVHKAVFEHKEKESGMTIHFVNERYDEGHTVLQAHCKLSEDDTPETIAKKVLVLEHKFYPPTVELLVSQL